MGEELRGFAERIHNVALFQPLFDLQRSRKYPEYDALAVGFGILLFTLENMLIGREHCDHQEIAAYVRQMMAESNNIQMICLTALTEDTIFSYFPAVYSLRLRPFMGKDYMTSKIERGFYQIDPLEEELRKKRQIEFKWE